MHSNKQLISLVLVRPALCLFCLLIINGTANAATSEINQIDWFPMAMGLFGGLALFLFGMDQMSEGLKAAAGDSLKILLSKLTKNRIMGALTGAIVTAVLNSSSVTTVLLVGFITAGIMTLTQSIGVIMGANIGSTFTAQIVAFNVTQYSLLMVAIGFALLYLGKQEKTRHSGSMIMGLGMVFLGMGVMSDAMNPMRNYEPFLELMVKMENPLLGILVGAVFTGLVQSSAATTGIAIVMASDGLVTLPAGIALAFGANIGTCVTAILAAIGKPVEAQRAAAAHILFNVIGVMLWVPFIPELADIVKDISPAYPDLTGSKRLGAEVPRQIANAHSVFNIANTLIFISFTGVFARVVVKLIPERAEIKKTIIEPKFLDEASLKAPSIALDRIRMEIGHMGEVVQTMLKHIGPAIQLRSRKQVEEIAKMDDQVDILHQAIIDYFGKLQAQPLTEQQNKTFLRLMNATDDLERIGDVIETNLVTLGYKIIDENIHHVGDSDTLEHVIKGLYERVCQSVEHAINAVREMDQLEAQKVVSMKEELNHLVAEALEFQTSHLSVEQPDQIVQFRLEDEVIDDLKRIYSLAKRVARTTLPVVLLQEEE